jgi:hypothetical protein
MMLVQLNYLVFSKRAEATVTRAEGVVYWQERNGQRTEQRAIRVSYKFVEPDGTRRDGHDEFPASMGYQCGQKITVEYTSGDLGTSRVAGNWNVVWIILFFVSGAMLGAFGLFEWIAASREVAALYPKPKKKKKKARRMRVPDDDE